MNWKIVYKKLFRNQRQRERIFEKVWNGILDSLCYYLVHFKSSCKMYHLMNFIIKLGFLEKKGKKQGMRNIE